jgi:hypothetical protein
MPGRPPCMAMTCLRRREKWEALLFIARWPIISASVVSATTLRLRITFHRCRNCRLLPSKMDSSTTALFSRRSAEGGFDGSVAYEICSPIQDGGSEDTLDRYARLFVEFMESLRSAKTAEVSRR